jgi:hypothetical protein
VRGGAGGTSTAGGLVSVTGGAGDGSSGGGSAQVTGGLAGATGNGGAAGLDGGDGGATSGHGGDASVRGGEPQAGNSNGGDVNLVPRAATGSGTDGNAYVGTKTIITEVLAGTNVTVTPVTDSINGKSVTINSTASGGNAHWVDDDDGFASTNSTTPVLLHETAASDALDGETWEFMCSCEAAHPTGSSSINLMIDIQIQTAVSTWTSIMEWETNPQLTNVVSDASEPQAKGVEVDVVYDNPTIRWYIRLTSASGASSTVSDANTFGFYVQDTPP